MGVKIHNAKYKMFYLKYINQSFEMVYSQTKGNHHFFEEYFPYHEISWNIKISYKKCDKLPTKKYRQFYQLIKKAKKKTNPQGKRANIYACTNKLMMFTNATRMIEVFLGIYAKDIRIADKFFVLDWGASFFMKCISPNTQFHPTVAWGIKYYRQTRVRYMSSRTHCT